MDTSVTNPGIVSDDAFGVSGGFAPDDRFAAIRERLEAPDWGPSGRAAGAALGNIANISPAVSAQFESYDRDGWRLARFERRQRSSGWLIGHAREQVGLERDGSGARAGSDDWVRPLRPARCRWRVASAVGVHSDAEHEAAHYSGLERCASVWSCPVCSAVIRHRRADEIGRAAERATTLEHGQLFVTLTLRHRDSDALVDTLDLLMRAWGRLIAGRPWLRLKQRIGWIGAVRATEVTLGGNGWHPHSHLLMVTEKPLTEAQLEDVQATLSTLWIRAVQKLGGRLPTQEHGVLVKAVDDHGTTIADYLVKVQEKQGERRVSIGVELVRGDIKAGRAGSLNPFELLDAQGEGSEAARRLWVEYVEATRGRRALSWSRGLREYLLPDEEEQTDDEVVEDTEQADLLAVIAAEDYDRNMKNQPEVLAAVLEAAEAGDIEMIEALAVDHPPPERRKPGPRFR